MVSDLQAPQRRPIGELQFLFLFLRPWRRSGDTPQADLEVIGTGWASA